MGQIVPENQQFDGNNFYTFKNMAMAALMAKGLGSALLPGSTLTTAEDLRAKFMLVPWVKPDYHKHVTEAATARAAWVALEGVNAANAKRRVPTLLGKLTTLRMTKPFTVTAFCSEIEQLQFNLKAAGYPIFDEQLCHTLLNGLPSEYDMFKTAVRVGAMPPLTELFDMAKGQEEQLNAGSKSMAMLGFPRGAAGGGGGRPGGAAGGGGSNPHKDKVCHYCGKEGHIKSVCRKLQRDKATGGGASTSTGGGKGGHVSFKGQGGNGGGGNKAGGDLMLAGLTSGIAEDSGVEHGGLDIQIVGCVCSSTSVVQFGLKNSCRAREQQHACGV